MYEFIEGILESIQPTYIVVNAGGLGFKIQTANPYSFQDDLGQNIRVYIDQVVRERTGTIDLFGFKDLEEKELFLTLNRVSGIGPKSAMSILALGDHQGLINAIENGDDKYLTKFPGVGKKTAQQMILDLQGELDFISDDTTLEKAPANANQVILDEVYEALQGLGYSQRELKKIEKTMSEKDFTTTQDALSYAFTLLI